MLFFGGSTALAGAYGIAVTLTMMITTVLAYFVVRDVPGSCRRRWPWAPPSVFLAVDALLVAGCGIKLLDGGWFPLALGLILFVLMSTWSRSAARGCSKAFASDGLELQPFIDALEPAVRCSVSTARPSTPWPTARPRCRRRCCTT